MAEETVCAKILGWRVLAVYVQGIAECWHPRGRESQESIVGNQIGKFFFQCIKALSLCIPGPQRHPSWRKAQDTPSYMSKLLLAS